MYEFRILTDPPASQHSKVIAGFTNFTDAVQWAEAYWKPVYFAIYRQDLLVGSWLYNQRAR